MIKTLQDNPYRLFFLLGALAAVIGTALWIPYGFTWMSYYPGRVHAHFMMGLFLVCFASGFLMTALPKMTQTFPAKTYELALQTGALIFVAAVSFSSQDSSLFFVGILMSVLTLLVFALRRLSVRKNHLPEVFPFVVMGLLSGVGGALLWILGYETLGHRLFYLNFILCLVLGVGSRLIPALLALVIPPRVISTLEARSMAIGVTAACFLEEFNHATTGAWLRAVLVVWVALRCWRITAKSAFSSGLGWGIRLAALSVVAGTVLLAAVPDYPLEWLHLIYISGFGLLSFMVASRVILAHGQHDLGLEIKNWKIKSPIILILLSALTRTLAPFWPESYGHHLAYAALIFSSGVIVWASFFVPKLFEKPTVKIESFKIINKTL